MSNATETTTYGNLAEIADDLRLYDRYALYDMGLIPLGPANRCLRRTREGYIIRYECAYASDSTGLWLATECRPVEMRDKIDRSAQVQHGERKYLADGTMYLCSDEGLGLRVRQSLPIAGADVRRGDPYVQWSEVDVYATLRGRLVVHSRSGNNWSDGRATRSAVRSYDTVAAAWAAAEEWDALRVAMESAADLLAALPLIDTSTIAIGGNG